jgi:phospho-N-acetylmuramoyl-pentapeptide-transferase
MGSAALVAAATFLVTLPWGGRFVAALLRRGIGKNIRAEEPDANQRKAGTPTMGGLYLVAGLTAASAVLALAGYPKVLAPLAVTLAYGALGAYDDLRALRDVSAVGWLARYKFAAQCALALVLAVLLTLVAEERVLIVPLTGRVVEIGWWFLPIAAMVIVAVSNGVNLADGMDGLAGGTSAIAVGAYAVLALDAGQLWLGLFAAALVGATMAFLWFNVHPARVFMGDVGAQALGAGLAAIAMLSGHWLVLPLIGLVFTLEALSDVIQVGYFKWSRRRTGEGRRVFRMAPLHYHYSLGGMPETRVTLRLWIVGLIAALAGVALAVGRI